MKLTIYKPGQGKNTRLASGIVTAGLVGMGNYRLYEKLVANNVNLWISVMVPVGIFVLLTILVFLLINRQSVADFLINAEGELKKVSWSSKQEIYVSTVVVIVVVILMASMLGLADLVFQMFFSTILGY
jgi:preprotein translocase subunit SecE